jgi:catechol 2,3-dioxygenase-like lactoylglutathione lyase family enzyme
MVALCDPVLFPREWRTHCALDNPIAAAARKRRERWSSRDEAFQSYRGRGPFAKWPDEMLRLYVEHGFATEKSGVRLKCPPPIEAQVFSMDLDFDGWCVLDRLAVPALVVRGAESEVFSANDATELLRRIADGELRTLDATTHLFPMEQPSEVAETILAFADTRLPIATRGLAHLALNVRQLEETARFYADVFGMRVVWQPDPDNVYLSSGRDNLALHRAREPRAAEGSPLDHLGFFVESRERVHAVAQALERRGIALSRPPRDHRDGSTSLYLEDPDGNSVQVLYEPNALRKYPVTVGAGVATDGSVPPRRR